MIPAEYPHHPWFRFRIVFTPPCFHFLEPGDEVLIPDPSYPNNTQNATLMGAVAVHVPLRPEKTAIGCRWRNSGDCAPTQNGGTHQSQQPHIHCFSKAEISELCRLIVKDLILVVDQAFEDILFDDHTMVHAALEEVCGNAPSQCVRFPKAWGSAVTVLAIWWPTRGSWIGCTERPSRWARAQYPGPNRAPKFPRRQLHGATVKAS